jgi:hypothetical protein
MPDLVRPLPRRRKLSSARSVKPTSEYVCFSCSIYALVRAVNVLMVH